MALVVFKTTVAPPRAGEVGSIPALSALFERRAADLKEIFLLPAASRSYCVRMSREQILKLTALSSSAG